MKGYKQCTSLQASACWSTLIILAHCIFTIMWRFRRLSRELWIAYMTFLFSPSNYTCLWTVYKLWPFCTNDKIYHGYFNPFLIFLIWFCKTFSNAWNAYFEYLHFSFILIFTVNYQFIWVYIVSRAKWKFLTPADHTETHRLLIMLTINQEKQ